MKRSSVALMLTQKEMGLATSEVRRLQAIEIRRSFGVSIQLITMNFQNIVHAVTMYFLKRKTIDLLSQMDDRQLNDIGLRRSQILGFAKLASKRQFSQTSDEFSRAA